ncbi:MAG: hypothetical protein K6G69_03020 [Lachnospiraceae bacterium]|nr:hypothetical protein [Lachnospiraceae bacterium]
MVKAWIRWAVIAVVFLASLCISSIILNQGTTDMTVEMQEATLPVISVLYNGKNVNYMRGFTSRKDNGTMRESICPVGEDRALSFVIDSYDMGISSVRYEVRSVDGSRLIEDTNVGNYEQRRGSIYGTINLKDLIEDRIEYNLCFILSLSDGREAYYYTRIIRDDIDVNAKIGFVEDFMTKTFESTGLKEISSYMETNSDGDNSSFGKVDIHSNKTQLGWGELYPRKYGDVITTIHEMDRTTASISLEYMLNVRQDNETYIYKVTEYYRIRQSDERFYLLSFDRKMDQIFKPEKESFVNNKIMLGIQSSEANLVESEDGNIFAFVNGGRLFAYDISANKFATLYAYYDPGDTDLRKTYDKSKIKILDVEENGNVSFMVYGYMNRGMHEGKVGVIVYYFNSPLNTIEEQAYIEYDKSPEVLICDVDRLGYLNSQGCLVLGIDGNIEEFDLGSMTADTLAENIDELSLHVSDSNRTAVWQEKDNVNSDLYVLDMKDDFVSTVEKQDDECARAIGFMNEDLIYGISKQRELITGTLGDVVLPMEKILIRSEYGAILKEYDFDDIYVTEGTITGNQISLKRIKKNEDGSFSEVHDDQITNNDEIEVGKNKVVYAVTDKYEKIAQVEMKKEVDIKTLKFLTPKEVLYEGGKEISIPRHEEKNRFYMYYNGHIVDICDDPGYNVGQAALTRATIVDNKGNEIYKRASTVVRNQIMAIKEDSMATDRSSMSVCLDTMLKLRGISRNTEYMLNRGQTPIEILENNLSDVYVINMSGAGIDSVFYYLNKDIPVMAVTDNDQAILLIGYNEQNLVWYDPSTQTIYKKGIKDSAEIFEQSDNRFLTYSPKITE